MAGRQRCNPGKDFRHDQFHRFTPSHQRPGGRLAGVVQRETQAADVPRGELTREQVRAEYQRARAAGELASPGELYAPVWQAIAQSQRSVRALAAAREAQPTAAAVAQRPASAMR